MNKIKQSISQSANAFTNCVKEDMVATWHAIKGTNLKFLLLIPLVAYVYFSFTMPISHDEAYTYLHFIKPSFWIGASYYPAPNNHLLYSLLANTTEAIPFLDLRFAVRLPAIIASLLSLIVIFLFVRKYYSSQMATLVTAFTSIGVIYILYSFYSRGYSLLILFTVVCLYMAFNIINQGNRAKHWVYFAISGILGFYTMPTFLYPFVSINLFLLCYNYKQILVQIYYNVWVVVVVFLLYLPVIVFSGIDSLVNNQFVVPIHRMAVLSRLPGFLVGTINELFGLPYYFVLPIIGLIIIYTIIKQEKQLLLLWLLFCLIPIVMIIGQSVIPFYRSFVYLGFILIYLCLSPFNSSLQRIATKRMLILALLIQTAGTISFYKKSDFYAMITATYSNVVEATIENNKTYFVQCGLIFTNYIFEADRKGYNSKFYDGGITPSVSVDTLQGYDYCVIDSAIDKTKIRKPDISISGFRCTPVHIYK